MNNILYLVVGCQNGEIKDSFAYLTYGEAYAKLKGIYDDNISYGGYDENDTSLNDWGFTIAFYSGWMETSIQQVAHPGIRVGLPDDRALFADDKRDPDYPGIKIMVLKKDQTPQNCQDITAWTEYNTARDDYTDNQRLRTIVWAATQDEPVLNLGYDTGDVERD